MLSFIYINHHTKIHPLGANLKSIESFDQYQYATDTVFQKPTIIVEQCGGPSGPALLTQFHTHSFY